MANAVQQTQSKPTFIKKDIQQTVRDTIIRQLEVGTVPWHKPWAEGENGFSFVLPENHLTGNKYRGINIVLLWSSAIENNYHSSEWASFKQWQQKKEAIRKGEKGSMIVYYDTIDREVDGEVQKIPFLKSSVVFNRQQLASFVADEKENHEPKVNLVEKIETVEAFICNTKANIVHEGGRAFYRPTTDYITMPHPEYFLDTATCSASEGYYSTLLHELSHWSGTEQRLNRTKGKKFGDHDYAVEELTAEFGAAFLCAGFGIATLEKGDHAAYIESWLKALKENKSYLFTAASQASKIVDYLYGLQPA